jgi:hypothetical protein
MRIFSPYGCLHWDIATFKLHSDLMIAPPDYPAPLRKVSPPRQIQTEMVGQVADIANNKLCSFVG